MTFEEWRSNRTSDVHQDTIFSVGEQYLMGDFAAAEAVEVFIYDDAAVFKLADGSYYNSAEEGFSRTLEDAERAVWAHLRREPKTADAYTVAKHNCATGGVTVALSLNGHGGELLRHFSGNNGAAKAEAYAAALKKVADILNAAVA